MADQSPVKRQTAYSCTAKHVLEGEYVRREGWEPNYLLSSIGALSRVCLAGIIVEQEPSSLVLDDGTGRVALRAFDKDVSSFSIGDLVMVVGRPRAYAEQNYVLIEILRRLDSHAWLKYYAKRRDSSLLHMPTPLLMTEPREPATPAPQAIPAANPSLITIIRDLDPGDGAPTDEVLRKAGSGSEKKLQLLIAEGEVFELRAGKIKVLE